MFNNFTQECGNEYYKHFESDIKRFAVEYAEKRLALLDVSQLRELLMGFASLIHEKMNFIDAHSPHVYIDDYLTHL